MSDAIVHEDAAAVAGGAAPESEPAAAPDTRVAGDALEGPEPSRKGAREAGGTHRDELRIALSMRGGVSLAVWIGGGVSELDRLVRAEPDGNLSPSSAGIYGALLELSGYARVVIDVVTGASAGGLNGVIYAASHAYGFSFDDMSRLWVELADLGKLTRDPWARYDEKGVEAKKGVRRPPSLLRGDAYFLERLAAQLRQKIDEAHRDGREGRLDPLELILSATLVAPSQVARTDDPFSRIVELRRSASFSFRYLGKTSDRAGDFQLPKTAIAADNNSTVQLLALAARATSSFPVAFEPATVTAAAAKVFSDAPRAPHDDSARVFDGGVLDNIPVTKALTAINASSSGSPSDRWLVFLHPSPSERAEKGTKLPQTNSPSSIGTLVTTAAAMLGQESLLDDLDELVRNNDEARRQRIRRDYILGTATHATKGSSPKPVAFAAAESQRTNVVSMRAAIDATRAERVLATLRGEGADIGDQTRSASGDQLHDALTESLCLQYGFGKKGAVKRAVRSPASLQLVIDQLIGWIARRGDAMHTEEVAQEVARCKETLYRWRHVVTAVQTAIDDAWVERARRGIRIDQAWTDETARLVLSFGTRAPAAEALEVKDRLDEAARATASASPRKAADLNTRFQAALTALEDAYAARTTAGAASLDCSNGREPDPVNLCDMAWKGVVDVAERARGTLPAPDPSEASNGLDRLLQVEAGEGESATSDLLEALVILTMPLQAASLQSDSSIRFLRIAGSNPTPLAPLLMEPDETELSVDAKLCGNRFANFAAFLCARWRVNDWMWGRCDAAKSIVDLLIRSERLAAAHVPPARSACLVERIASEAGVHLTDAIRRDIRGELAAAAVACETTIDLRITKQVLVEALQRHIFTELIDVAGAADELPRWPTDDEIHEVREQNKGRTLDQRLREYSVGREGARDLNPRRRTQLGMRVALVGWSAALPAGNGRAWFARQSMRLLKPFYLLCAFAALALPGTLLLVTASMAGVVLGPWRLRNDPSFTWNDFLLKQSHGDFWRPRNLWHAEPSFLNIVAVGIVALLVAAGLWYGRKHRTKAKGDRQWYRWTALLGVGALVGTATGWRLGAPLIVIGATIIVWCATSWMRFWYCALAGLLTAVAYAGTAALSAWWGSQRSHVAFWDAGSYSGWWPLIALLTAATLVTLECSLLRVLPDELRPKKSRYTRRLLRRARSVSAN